MSRDGGANNWTNYNNICLCFSIQKRNSESKYFLEIRCVTSHHTTTHHVTIQHNTTQQNTTQQNTTQHNTTHNNTTHLIILHHIKWHYITLQHITPRYNTSHLTTTHHTPSHHILFHPITKGLPLSVLWSNEESRIFNSSIFCSRLGWNWIGAEWCTVCIESDN